MSQNNGLDGENRLRKRRKAFNPLKRWWRQFCEVRKKSFLLVILRKGKPSLESSMHHFWTDWRQRSQGNFREWLRKRCRSTTTMHRSIQAVLLRKNWPNCALNCFRIQPIHPIWFLEISICSENSKLFWLKKSLYIMKKLFRRLRGRSHNTSCDF